MELFSKWIAKISMFVSASCTGILAVIMMLQIFCRKVLSSSLSWSDEMGGYLLAWIALYGAVTALYEKKHLAIDALVDKMPNNIKQTMYLVIDMLTAIFVFIIFYFSIPLMQKVGGMTAVSLPIPKIIIYSPLLITSVFSLIILLNDMRKDLQGILGAKGDEVI